jgi:hypothetical protein
VDLKNEHDHVITTMYTVKATNDTASVVDGVDRGEIKIIINSPCRQSYKSHARNIQTHIIYFIARCSLSFSLVLSSSSPEQPVLSIGCRRGIGGSSPQMYLPASVGGMCYGFQRQTINTRQ